MDHQAFDRIARLLGGAVTRRSGLAAAIGSVLGAPAAADSLAAARRGNGTGHGTTGGAESRARSKHPKPEGPCGDRSRKDNLCTKDKQCCTNYCKKGLKNKDGKGRCRCIKKGKPCKPNQTCCGKFTCTEGRCQRLKPGIPTGQACVAGVDTCESADASCIPYFQADPGGTYCLLANGKTCAAATDCASKDCTGGVCVAEVCTVCASGCPYTTIQAAATGVADGAVVRIAGATYSEDVVVPAKNLVLTNCNGGAVIVKNATDDTRTFTLGSDNDTAPHPTVIIRNLTVSGKGAPAAGDATPVAPTVGDGGIEVYTNLALEGTTKVTGCNWLDNGGGIAMWPQDEALTLTVRGKAEVSDNFGDGRGGGIWVDSYTYGMLILEDDAKVTRNYATEEGGGIYIGYEILMEMSGDAEISYNRGEGEGGGGYIYCSTDRLCLKMTGRSRWIHNTVDGDVGGGIFLYDGTDTYPNAIEMNDDTLIADNQAINYDSYGAGIHSDADDARLLMTGNARITRNTVVGATGADGGGVYEIVLDIRDNAAIIDNSPGNCENVVYDPGSKQCGVA